MRRFSWPWERRLGKYSRRGASANLKKSLSLYYLGHCQRIARVSNSASESKGGRPGFDARGGCSRCHHSSTTTYKETQQRFQIHTTAFPSKGRGSRDEISLELT